MNDQPTHEKASTTGTLRVTAAHSVLTLRNETGQPVGYLVTDADMMTIALFPPCGDSCPVLQPGDSATVAYTAIDGYTEASTEASVKWWRYARSADGSLHAEGALQTVAVPLR
jgi:hypothetical protein